MDKMSKNANNKRHKVSILKFVMSQTIDNVTKPHSRQHKKNEGLNVS